MPFPWVAAAKVIPWADVIAAAPAIASSARKLWKQVRREGEQGPGAPADPAVNTPEMRLERLEEHLAALSREAEARSELIASLAEQNEQLVAALDRQKEISRFALIIAAAALGGVVLALLR